MKISNFKFQIIFVILLLIFGVVGRVSAQVIDSSSGQATESSKIDYTMPYPGLLPDNPLYFIKTARDRTIAFFMSNPVKKAEFDLLQADKRVQASSLLVQKNKIDLAQSTFSKAENYFEDALNRLNDAKTQGTNISELAGKLTIANKKHQEILSEITIKLSKKDKSKFNLEHKRLIEFEKRSKILSK